MATSILTRKFFHLGYDRRGARKAAKPVMAINAPADSLADRGM